MEKFKYRILTLLRYISDAMYYPFVALYLKDRGFIESRIGLLLSLAPLMGLIMSPIFSKICKTTKITKRVLCIIGLCEGIIISLIAFQTSFIPIVVLTILLSIFGSCHYGLMDSLITIYSSHKNIAYTSIRLFGSLGYVIGTNLGGIIISAYSYQVLFVGATLLFIISSVLYLTLETFEEEKKTEKVEFKVIFKNKRFLMFAAVYILFYSLCFSSDNFFSIFLKTQGLYDGQYGFIVAYYVIIETILMLILVRLKNTFNSDYLLLISFSCLFLRQFINFLNPNIYIVLIMSGLRGISIAILFHVSFTYALKILGEDYATAGILFMTFGQLLGLFLLYNLNGFLIDKLGFTCFYLICAIAAIVLILLQVIRIIINKKLKRESIKI